MAVTLLAMSSLMMLLKKSGTTSEPVRRRLTVTLWLESLMGALGLYSVIPVLGVLLASRSPGSGTAVVGIGLFCYTASAGLSATLVNRWLPGLSYARGMVGAVLLSAVAFGLLPYTRTDWVLCALLVLAGFGVSVHFLLSRVLIAEVVHDDIGRNRVFSALQIAVNAAAALGPFVANLLYSSAGPRMLMGVVALCYLAAAAVMVPGIPRGERPPATTGKWPVSWRVVVLVLRNPDIRGVVAVSVLGAFVYAQFYSAFALYVGKEFESALLRAVLIAGPAVWIVLLQTPVTLMVGRLVRAGATPLTVLGCANVLFALSMVLLGLGLAPTIGAVLAAVVFSVAEMMFGPMTSTAYAGLPIGSSLESFNLRQFCWTAGEALGSLVGGTVFLALYLTQDGWLYWDVLGITTLAVTGLLLLAQRARHGANPAAPTIRRSVEEF
jgi:MFS family permease